MDDRSTDGTGALVDRARPARTGGCTRPRPDPARRMAGQAQRPPPGTRRWRAVSGSSSATPTSTSPRKRSSGRWPSPRRGGWITSRSSPSCFPLQPGGGCGDGLVLADRAGDGPGVAGLDPRSRSAGAWAPSGSSGARRWSGAPASSTSGWKSPTTWRWARCSRRRGPEWAGERARRWCSSPTIARSRRWSAARRRPRRSSTIASRRRWRGRLRSQRAGAGARPVGGLRLLAAGESARCRGTPFCSGQHRLDVPLRRPETPPAVLYPLGVLSTRRCSSALDGLPGRGADSSGGRRSTGRRSCVSDGG